MGTSLDVLLPAGRRGRLALSAPGMPLTERASSVPIPEAEDDALFVGESG